MNILLVCIDDVRFDVVFGKYRSMPNLAKLAEQGLCFVNAYTTSTWSAQVAYSVLMGVDSLQTPFQIGSEKDQTVRNQKFAYEGVYFDRRHSIGVSANCWVSSQFGFDSLFDQWYDNRVDSEGLASRLLNNVPSPTFFYLHLMGAHDRRTNKRYQRSELTVDNFERYRQACFEMDDRLKRFFELEDWIVCVYSDHGEYFPALNKEERVERVGHGQSLSPSLVHVPLVVWYKGCKPKVMKGIVSLSSIVNKLFVFDSGIVADFDEPVSMFLSKGPNAKRAKFTRESLEGNGHYDEFDLNTFELRQYQHSLLSEVPDALFK